MQVKRGVLVSNNNHNDLHLFLNLLCVLISAFLSGPNSLQHISSPDEPVGSH